MYKFKMASVLYHMSVKISIRHPYQGEIVRNFPSEMFFALKTSVQHSRKEEITNNVFYNDNKNRNVMSFSSRKAVIVFLSLLSGYSETNVKGFFKKILAGRTHGKARVIVSCSKEFSFTYNIKTGQNVSLFIMEYGTRQVSLSITSDENKTCILQPCCHLE